MKNIVHSYVRKFREERRKSHRAVALLLALALVVSTGVSWQLHATGIALTNETYCGLEEHTHTEDCYEQVLVCGQEESEGHTHTDACYETETTLVCGREESEGHTHDESCYDEDGNLICGKEESEGHTHTDACYETETVLVCGREESEGHTHTDSCYETQLTCGKEEHTHTVDCLTDETADVETAADWEATLPELTGVWADDVAAIAKSQLGYTESAANFTLADDGETRQGYTRYGAWYGNEYGDWDAMFASFCLYYAGVDEEAFPQASGVYAWTVALNELGLYDEDAEPTNGDLVFFDTDKDGKADHVGVVAGVSDYKVTVIEGDSDDKVQSTAYSLNDSTITGYGVLPEQEETEDEAEIETETTTLTYEGEDFTVTVTYGADAELPEGVELIASEYAQDSETYLARYAEAAELYGWEEDYTDEFRLFNIGLYVNGEEVEPSAAVQVTITYLNQEGESENYTITHFADEGTETIEAASENQDGSQTVTFESNSFSDMGGTNGPPGGGDFGGGGDQGGGSTTTSGYYHVDLRVQGTFTITVTNTTSGETDLTVNKVWADGSDNHSNETITVYLTDSEGNYVTYTDSNGETQYYTADLSAENSWSYTWEDITLEDGTYYVTDTVSGYTASSDYVVIDSDDTDEDSSETTSVTYTGTITVTSLTKLTIYADGDLTGTGVEIEMQTSSTQDETSTDYEFASVCGHGSNGQAPTSTLKDYIDMEDGDVIAVEVTYTYSYSYTDETGETITKIGTATATVYVTVDEDSNICEGTENTDQYGYDFTITAEQLLNDAEVIVTDQTLTLTNTPSDTNVTIQKVDENGEALSGAVFTLTNSSNQYYDGESWSGTESTLTLGTKTVALSDGTYTLTETSAPDGYNLLSESISFTVSGGTVTEATYGSGTTTGVVSVGDDRVSITVTNTPGVELPETGGSGTWLYTLAGLVLCCGAALLLFRRKETE